MLIRSAEMTQIRLTRATGRNCFYRYLMPLGRDGCRVRTQRRSAGQSTTGCTVGVLARFRGARLYPSTPHRCSAQARPSVGLTWATSTRRSVTRPRISADSATVRVRSLSRSAVASAWSAFSASLCNRSGPKKLGPATPRRHFTPSESARFAVAAARLACSLLPGRKSPGRTRPR